MKKPILRPITPADNPAMASIIRDVMTEFNSAGPGYSINDPEVDHIYHAYNDPSRSAFFILEIDGQVVGGGGIGPLANGKEDICELRKMYFLPQARGRGWGRKMVELCLETAQKLGYKTCYLETVERMEAANLLYRKMGFRPLNARMGDTGHCGCDTYFAKELVTNGNGS